MRDIDTIATGRKRAREVLLNNQNSLEDKRKAASKLLNTYEKVGKKTSRNRQFTNKNMAY